MIGEHKTIIIYIILFGLFIFGTIVLPPLFIYLLDTFCWSFPLLVFISFFLVFLDFYYARDWSDYE